MSDSDIKQKLVELWNQARKTRGVFESWQLFQNGLTLIRYTDPDDTTPPPDPNRAPAPIGHN